jgi:hypothetical protein
MSDPDADPGLPQGGNGTVIVATPEQIAEYNLKRGKNTRFGSTGVEIDTSVPPPSRDKAPIILVNPDDDSVWVSTQMTAGVPTNFNRFGGNVNGGRPDGPTPPPGGGEPHREPAPCARSSSARSAVHDADGRQPRHLRGRACRRRRRLPPGPRHARAAVIRPAHDPAPCGRSAPERPDEGSIVLLNEGVDALVRCPRARLAARDAQPPRRGGGLVRGARVGAVVPTESAVDRLDASRSPTETRAGRQALTSGRPGPGSGGRQRRFVGGRSRGVGARRRP